MLRNYNFYTVNKKIVAHIALSLLHALENQNSQQLSFDNLIILMHILCITHCVCMCVAILIDFMIERNQWFVAQ